MPPKVTPKFQEGERVMCFHGPMVYEAKCVKCEIKDKSIRYLIHYSGWNKSWDEWVLESRVLKYNEASLQKQRELQKVHLKNKQTKAQARKKEKEKEKEKERREKEEQKKKGEKVTQEKDKSKDSDKDDKKKKEKSTQDKDADKDDRKRKEKSALDKDAEKDDKKRKEKPAQEKPKEAEKDDKKRKEKPAQEKPKEVTQTTPITSSSETRDASSEPVRKKRARVDATVESEESFTTKIEVKIKIPEELKPWLVDDWDLITRQKQLVNVPCKVTVDGILDEYVRVKLAKPNNLHKEAILEVTQGIREYFNVLLGTQLLYKFERPQYSKVLADHPDKPMTSIYGATHLLRLFVKLGGMLAYTPLDDKSIQMLLTHIHDLLRYMQKNSTNYFNVSDYSIAPPEYHRRVL